MAENPVLSYRGPGAPGFPVTLKFYDTALAPVTVRGTFGEAARSPADTAAAWSTGSQIWLSGYQGDPDQIEFCEFSHPVSDVPVMHRVIFRERLVSGLGWSTIRCVLQTDAEPGGQLHSDFDPVDFNNDFA